MKLKPKNISEVSITIHTKERGRIKNPIGDWMKIYTLHRTDGPAVYKYINGKLRQKQYWYNSKLHREDGPAIIEYDDFSHIINTIYMLNGELISEHEYDAELLKLKLDLL